MCPGKGWQGGEEALAGPQVLAPIHTRAPAGDQLQSRPDCHFRRDRSSVSVNLENAPHHQLEVAVDHDYYRKLGR